MTIKTNAHLFYSDKEIGALWENQSCASSFPDKETACLKKLNKSNTFTSRKNTLFEYFVQLEHVYSEILVSAA